MPIREITIDKIPDARAALSLIQGEGRAQIVRFVIDRNEGGVDLSGLQWMVRAVNAAGDSDVYMLDAPTFDDKTLTVDWLVHGVATAVAGETRFELQGVAEADGPVVWKNGTRTIKVYESLDAIPSEDDEQLTALQTLILHVRNELDGVVAAGQAAGKAAAEADEIRARAEAAETARSQAETARAEAETAREQAETARAEAEAARLETEADRAEAEQRRINAEAGRADAEAGRNAAEEARNVAEAARAEAEEARALAWAETKSAAEAATESANTAAAKAETATAAADAAKGAAEEAAGKATTAAGAANAAADAAEEAAEKATTAAGTATAAAETATAAGAAASAAAETATAAAAEANAAAEAATAAAESVAEHLDGQYAALMDDTNTTALFKRWWTATEGEGTKYERLCRWFDRIMRCDATFTVRFFYEAVSGDPSGTALDDLAALGPAPVATDTDAPESDWSVDHRMTWYIRANGLQREDGGLDVLAIEGEDGFDLTGEIAPVVTISCALYRKTWEADGYWYKSWRNSPAEGYTILPEGVRPDGSIRPFVWHSTFPGALTADGRLTSGAGRKINNFAAAQNAIANARKMGAFEGLMTDCDSIWALDQFQMRHVNKENGGIMEGCCRFNYQYAVALAETGVNRVLLTTSQAANLHVGCAVAVGDPGEQTNLDRSQSYMRNIVADALVTSIDSVEIDGAAYAAVTLDVPEAFDTTATTRISTMPWHTGTTEAVPGHHDGSPGSNTNGHYPFRLAGVEFMAGAYDVGLDPLYITKIPESGKVNYRAWTCPDSTKQAGSEANYTDTGLDFQFATAGWQYARKFHDDGTVLMPTVVGGASETTHFKSAFYPASWAGRFCSWRRGNLGHNGFAGLAGANGSDGPGLAFWSGCPRLGGSGARRAAG